MTEQVAFPPAEDVLLKLFVLPQGFSSVLEAEMHWGTGCLLCKTVKVQT